MATLDEQIAHEQNMSNLGVDNILESLKVIDDNNPIVQTLINKCFEKLVSAIVAERLLISKKKGGPKPIIEKIHGMDLKGVYVSKKIKTETSTKTVKVPARLSSETLAFITLRMLFVGVSSKKSKDGTVFVGSILSSIGANLGDTINIAMKNDPIEDSDKMRLGISLYVLLAEACPEWFLIRKRYYRRTDKHIREVFDYTGEFQGFVMDNIDKLCYLCNVKTPMIHPPADWDENGFSGGYYTEQFERPLVKHGQFRNLDHRIVNGVNMIQRSPWMVDKDNLAVINVLNKTKPSSLKKFYPIKPLPVSTKPPPRMIDDKYIKFSELSEEEKTQARNHAASKDFYSKKCQAKISKDSSRSSAFEQAIMFADRKSIYFPHDNDYRTRIYNVSQTGLSTQGNGVQKGLIQFKTNRPITTLNGVKWMKINLANQCGQDKLPIVDKIEWVDDNLSLFNDVVKDPIKCELWHEWDKPLEGLQSAREWIKYTRNDQEPLNIHVQLDGRCNGIQHLAALTRDDKVAPHVGLIKTSTPGDIYTHVLNTLKVNVEKNNSPFARQWIDTGLMVRDLTKKPVMTRSYSATLRGIQDGVVEYLLENGGNKYFDKYYKAGYWMGQRIWESMGQSLAGPMRFLDWVQECGKVIAKNNKPFIWDNPIGMGCIHAPYEMKKTRIAVKVGYRLVRYDRLVPTNKIKVSKVKSSCSPNMIHGNDASHLLITVDRCIDKGVYSFAMVHDSYGTHPDDAEILLESAKEAWVDIYTINWLDKWYEQWGEYLGPGARDDLPHWSEFISIGTLDPHGVLDSDQFFG